MTDKEQLEEIKELVKKIESILYDEWQRQELTFLIESLYYADHINWLINRVEELEKQNKCYREVLEFYADQNNYREQELKGIVPPRPIKFKPILHDYGSIARQALEGENDR